MVDFDLIRQAIVQHWMMRHCGVKPEQWAFDFMLVTQKAGISTHDCFNYFSEWVNAGRLSD